jgi:hypothetical protein
MATKKKMQSGGTSGGYPKSGGKMMKKGGIKKTLKKAQDGSEVGPYIPSDLPPKSKDKRTYSGPLTERDTKALNERYPSTVGKAAVMTGRGTIKNPISPKGVEAYYRRNDENYLRSGSPEVQKWNASPNAEGEFYPTTNKSDFKKGGAKKTSTMKKMKTGGMVNSNAKVQALKVAGSKGVKSGVNPKAAASKVAKGRSGGTSAAPKTAVPKAKYGMTLSKKQKGGPSDAADAMIAQQLKSRAVQKGMNQARVAAKKGKAGKI